MLRPIRVYTSLTHNTTFSSLSHSLTIFIQHIASHTRGTLGKIHIDYFCINYTIVFAKSHSNRQDNFIELVKALSHICIIIV